MKSKAITGTVKKHPVVVAQWMMPCGRNPNGPRNNRKNCGNLPRKCSRGMICMGFTIILLSLLAVAVEEVGKNLGDFTIYGYFP